MSDVKWIKLKVNMFDDEKIRLIESMPDGDTMLIIWFKLLSQAGRTNANGYIFLNENVPYTPEMLSTLFNRPLQTVRYALQTFSKFGMIDVNENDFICISNWDKHQNIEGLEKIKSDGAERQRRYRERKKLAALGIEAPSKDSENNSDSNVTRNVTHNNEITSRNALEEELEKEKEYNIYISLFEFWNSNKIIVHKKFNDTMKKHIKARIEEGYTVDELKEAIANYAQVLQSDEYYFSYKWTLQEFMNPKNVVKFMSDANPFETYKSTFGKKADKPKKPSAKKPEERGLNFDE